MIQNNKNGLSKISHEEEYSLIRKDLYKVVVINLLFFAGLLALYFANQQSGFLESWFANVV